jgi:hypothetical protein
MVRSHQRSFAGAIVAAIALMVFGVNRLSAQTNPASADSEDSAISSGLNPWAPLQGLGGGYLPTVAIHPSGLMVEVNQLGDSIHTYKGVVYRVGKLDAASGTVSWGQSHELKSWSDFSVHPSVVITREGYVIIAYSNLGAYNGTLRYFVGTLNPDGGADQTIQFRIFDQYYDRGYRSSLSVNYNGTIAEVHQEGSDQYNEELYYRLGHLTSPGTGDFSITWDTGTGGKYYEKGQTPSISINDNGDVAEMHIVPNENKIHYIRGRLSGDAIAFQQVHPPFASDDFAPTVALLNNGYVMTFHVYPKKDIFGSIVRYELKYRLSLLDPNDPIHMNWVSENEVWQTPKGSSIATNGSYAIAVAGDQGGELKYTWAIAP